MKYALSHALRRCALALALCLSLTPAGALAEAITTYDGLMRELEQTRVRGYAIDDEECELGARCIAVGITDYTGRIVGGVSISGPISRMTLKRIDEVAPLVQSTAKAISAALAAPGL